VEAPAAGDSFQLGQAALVELKLGAGHEVLHGRGDEDLAGPRFCRNPSADVDGNPRDLVSDDLALSRVQSGAHLDPELAHRFDDRVRAANGADRAVERGEEAVPRGVDLVTVELA
jgi:hypothetical protein